MKLLVVDDLADNRYLLEQLLRARGYAVVTANDGVAALEKLDESFGLIIADIMMPRMDGFELCYNVKLSPKLRHIPFVFYTATYTHEEDRKFALSLGADEFILKPEEPGAFVKRLQDVLNRARQAPVGVIAPRLTQDQVSFLKEYNARLVQKLEQKFEEAREANQKLHDLNRTLEERVAEKTSQLERSNQELESFARTISHDLRAPLRSVAGYSEALRESAAAKLSPEEQGWLGRIGASVERMGEMISDVLAYSRAAAGPVVCGRVEVERVVCDLIQSNPQFQGRVEVGALPPMLAHEPSLRQAIFNLLANAIKFVPPGIEPRVRVYSEPRPAYARLWIEDNGIGIPKEQQPKIFDLFERLDPNYEGSGIGLAIVAKAVERMNGTVGVESEVGKGSRFWIQLPVA